MKRTALSAMIGLALGVTASSAFALAPSAYNSTAGDTLDLFISGASAQDAGLIKAYAKSFCTAGSMDVYTFTNQSVTLCTSAVALTGGKTKLAIFKSSVGGSGNGIGPVADGTTLTFISMAALKANPALVTSTATVASTTGLPAYTTHAVSTTATQTAVPKAGLSDVEPALLGGTPAQVAKLTVQSPNALLMAVPVTKKIRDLLQAKEGLTVGSETEANMPNLTKTQLSGIYTGQITNWSQLGLTVTNDSIYVARRVNTSGTQKAYDIYFTGAACTSGAAPFVAANDGGTCGNDTVNEGSGSGNVTACLTTLDGASKGGVGVLSSEFVPVDPVAGTQVAGNNAYRFVKINGAAPTLLNAVEGKYDLYVETSYQFRSNITGNELTVLSAIPGKLGDPTVIDDIDNGLVQFWGRSGLLALPSNGYTPVAASGATISSADITANPVHTHTKSPFGSPNNCQVALPIANTDLFKQP